MNPEPSQRRLIVFAIAMVGLALVLGWALYEARSVVMLVYVSGLLAAGFLPLVRVVERQRLLPVGSRRFPKWLAILSIYLVILCTIVGVGAAVLPPLVDQARSLGEKAPGMVSQGQRWLFERGIIDQEYTFGELVKKAPGDVVGMGGDAATTVLSAVFGLAGGVFGIITILILTFYMLVESETIFATFVKLFPRDQRSRVAAVSREISSKVSAWLGGQLLLGAIIGITATIGLWLMGVPYFFVLGLIAGVGELIPMIGPLLAAIPAVAVGLAVSPGKALAVAIFFLLQQQFENHVLVPKVMSRQVGVSAVTVIIALLIGGSLLGIVGALLAVPTAAALQVIFQELTADDDSGR